MKDNSELIEGLKSKNSRALSELYDNYSGAIYGVIIRMCNDPDLAENLLQDTFLKAWEKAHQYDQSKGRFYTWLYRIARNTVLNALRNKKDLIQNADLSVYEDKTVDEDPPDYSGLNGSIKNLKEHHQQAIELVYFKGYTHKEAHELMKVPLGTFKSYIQQALKQLRESYGNE